MKKLLPLVGILALGAMPAYASSTHHTGTRHYDESSVWAKKYFNALDTDRDGFISRDEFIAHAQKKFDEMDTNGDGQLSRKEVIAYKKKEAADYKSWVKHGRPNTENLPESNDTGRAVTSEDSKTNTENKQ